MDAASSTAVALLLLLVVDVLNVCNLLWICGAMLQHSTGTNAACQQALVPAAMTNLHIVMRMMWHVCAGRYSLNLSAAKEGQGALASPG